MTNDNGRPSSLAKEKEWDAEIFEQVPDQRIAWRSMNGAKEFQDGQLRRDHRSNSPVSPCA